MFTQWCGDMAAKVLEPYGSPPVLMCNGQSANNTINSCDANDCTGFLNTNGQNGRVLLDQPGMYALCRGEVLGLTLRFPRGVLRVCVQDL